MIQVKIKKIFVILVSIMLFGCSSTNINGFDKYHEVIANMDNIDNYSKQSVISDKIHYENEGKIEDIEEVSEILFKSDGINTYSKTKYTSNLDDEYEEEKYYSDGKFYLSDKVNKYVVDEDENNTESFIINTEDLKDDVNIEKINVKKDGENYILNIKYNEKSQKEIYDAYASKFGLTSDDIKYSPYVYTIKVNDKVVEEKTKVAFTYSLGSIKIKYESEIVTSFFDYDKTVVQLPNDLNEYVALEKKPEVKELSIQDKLVSNLNYIKDKNLYTLVYNDNETYIFDFSLNMFIYKVGNESYSYNWKSELGSYDKCTYDFKQEKELGNCSEKNLEDIKATKGYLEVELIQIDKTIENLIMGE